MEQAKDSQEDFNNYLKTIWRGNKTKKLGNTFANINRLFNGRNYAIKFMKTMVQWFSRLKESCRRTNNRNRIQILAIALAQVKVGNNPENLLNEISQIVYSLYQSKEINNNIQL